LFDFGGTLIGPVSGHRYYYGQLNGEQKKMYAALLSGAVSMATEIVLPLKPINEIMRIFTSVILDNPLVFYVTSFNQTNDPNRQKSIVRPEYKYSKDFVRQHAGHVWDYLQVFDAVRSKSDIDKEMFVHDYCLNNFCYDYSFTDYSYSVLGLVLRRTAVCDGIAKFVKLAFDYLGIESLVVHGLAKNPSNVNTTESHAWNIVKIYGNYFHLDVTFDMTIKNKVNRYDYFNLCDNDIKKDHTIPHGVPPCTTPGKDYLSVNSMVAHSPAEFEKFVYASLIHGNKTIIVKLSNVKDTATIVDKVMAMALNQYSKVYSGSARVEISYNSSQLVFEINFV